MKKIKQIISISMICIMCLSFNGCNNSSKETEGAKETNTQKADYIPKETVTLNVFSDFSGNAGIQEGWFADIMLEKFNVKLNIITASKAISAGDSDRTYNGDYDIIMSGASTGVEFTQCLNDGCFLDFKKYDMDKYMPYISEYLKNSLVQQGTGENSLIYGIRASAGLAGDHSELLYTWDLRYDYYEELGKPEINTIDDWITVLSQMKEKHPTCANGDETYGLILFNDWNDGMLYCVKSFVNAWYGYETCGLGFYDHDENKYIDALNVDADGNYGPYLQMLMVYNQLYQMGLLDPESENYDYDAAYAKIENGQNLASLQAFMGSMANENMYPVIPAMANTSAYELGYGYPNRIISIDSETKYPELCMAILDYLYTPEGMLTTAYGPKGECWDYDKNGMTYLTETGVARFSREDTSAENGYPMFNLSPYNIMATNTDNNECYYYPYWENTSVEAVSKFLNNAAVEKYVHQLEPDYIIPDYDLETLDFLETNLKQEYIDVSNIIITKSWEAIKAPTYDDFVKIVNDMISDATAAGYNECIKYSQDFIKEKIK